MMICVTLHATSAKQNNLLLITRSVVVCLTLGVAAGAEIDGVVEFEDVASPAPELFTDIL